jgi:aspartate/methionine/tyrosine aminotransferase
MKGCSASSSRVSTTSRTEPATPPGPLGPASAIMSPMRIADFALERYFARWEFAVEHVLCASDVQGYPMADLLALADEETRAMWDDLALGYTESTGHPLLRREIAALYDAIDPEEVLVFAGAEEGIFCLVNVLLGPGDHAIVTWPGYQSLYEIARAAGADVTLHELREATDWAIDIDLLRRQVTPATRLIVVNAPHNPTGMLPDRATFDGLVGLAEEVGAHLLIDEVYRFLEFDEGDRLPAGADASPRGVSLGVMSKSFAMAGLRIGWLATRDRDLLDRCARVKDYTTICSAAPSEVLALIGLRARDVVLARSRDLVAANLERLDAFFDAWADRFSWVRPRAGSVAFPRLTVPGVSIDDWAAGLVEAEGVLLLPGSQFGFGGNHFRLGFGRTDLPAALARLESYAGRTLR